jgi:hypothetical protein
MKILDRSFGLQDVEAHESGKVVSPTHRPPLTTPPTPFQEIPLVLISVRG